MNALSNPKDVAAAQAIIKRLCALQAYVVTEALGYDHPADCFCGEDGFWPLDSEDDFKNEGKAIAFIEEAVIQAVEEHRLAAAGADTP